MQMPISAKLADLDRRYKETFLTCKKNIFIHGGHFAFNYLAKRYNLIYISAYHGSPDSEPTPKRLITLKKKMQENNIKYIYYEELIAPRVARGFGKGNRGNTPETPWCSQYLEGGVRKRCFVSFHHGREPEKSEGRS